MNTFLKYVAEDIYDKKDGNFQDTTIVFPNKRATLFFNNYLWQKSGGKTMWTPEYTTISELFSSLSTSSIADPIYLICQLYEVYLKHDPATDKSFDELYPLLEMMLADFQDVDNNLVPADKIFRNIAELQDLTDYSFLEPEQIEAIQHFFNGLNWNHGTNEQKQFTKLWDRLLGIYNDYQARLLSNTDPMLYEGMLKRRIAEAAMSSNALQESNATQNICSKLTSQTYVFVGFNVLNKAERELFKFIKKNKDTLFYWDYDLTYCSGNPYEADKKHRGFEAGIFILENIRDFGNAFSPSHEAYSNMKKPKTITFIQSPTENAQSRYIGEWVNKVIAPGDKQNESAIVLCNESLLQPTLHAIPSIIVSQEKKERLALNVTMGYPLSETPAYSLVQALIELQLKGRTQAGAWRYKQVAAVLKHPYIRRMTQGEANSTLLELTAKNVIFPKDSAFASSPILSQIFTKKTGKELTAYLSSVLSNAAVGLPVQMEEADFNTQLYKESTFAAYTTINRIHSQQESVPNMSALSDSTIARLVSRMLQSATIPFHGEPANGIQVMGFLETRNLDFRNVIMLSAGEGQMPRANKRPSLIPYTLQVAFGMTTIDKEVSIYAYYFYRLLQRAENITILWNTSTEDGHKGEMSRFLMQLMIEAERLFAEGQKIDLLSFVTPSESKGKTIIAIEKSDEIMERLHKKFDIATEQTPEWIETHKNSPYKLFLSASAILCSMKCQLQFFFKYVANLRPDDEVSEDIDDAIFGDIFHFVMEQIYRPFCGKPLTSRDIKEWANDDKYLAYLVDKGFLVKLFKLTDENSEERIKLGNINYSGTQLIKHHVLRKLIKIQLEADAQTAAEAEKTGGSLTILATEEEHSVIREIKPEGGETPFCIRLGGIIDRIDMVDDGCTKTIRIVDYKTSSTPHSASDIPQLFEANKVGSTYHITQTMYYCDVLTEEEAHDSDKYPVVPAIMYFKNNRNFLSPVVETAYPGMVTEGRKKKQYIKSYLTDCKDTFHPLMMQAIERIFEPGEYTQCEDDHTCLYCDFKQLCCRNPKKKY